MTAVDLTIDTIAAGGDGIGRADGVAVFVPRTAPGDRVRVSLDTRKRFARGTLDAVVSPSPDRIDPVCHHYRVDKCGGCQLQHLRYEAQLEAKRTIVRDAIVRIGKRSVERPGIERSEMEWRYRRKLTLAMRRAKGKWIIGLHPYDDAARVFQLADCPITDERVVSAWREVMDASRYFPPADELRASVRLADEGVSVVMQGGNEWPGRAEFFRPTASHSRRSRSFPLVLPGFPKQLLHRPSFPEPQPVIPGFPETVPDREVVLAQIILLADLF